MAELDPNLPLEPIQAETSFRQPSEPLANKSKGLLFSTIGQGIESVAKTGEQIGQQFLSDKVRAGVQVAQDATVKAYEAIRGAQVKGVQPPDWAVRTAGFGGSLATGGEENAAIPQGLQAGLDKSVQVGLAKAQGKANDTLYTGALAALQKQLRAEYPGHRDFIDEQMARITGINPANAYMQNLLIDINRATAGNNVQTKEILSRAMLNFHDPRVVTEYMKVYHNAPGASMDGLAGAVYKAEAEKAQRETYKFNAERMKGDAEADARLAEGQANTIVQQSREMHWDPVYQGMGLSSPKMIAELIQAGKTGEIPFSQQDQLKLLNLATAARDNFIRDTRTQLDSGGFSKRINNENRVKELIDGQDNAFFKPIVEAITHQGYGTAGELARRSKAELDQTTYNVDTSPLGEFTRKLQIMTQRAGPNFTNIAIGSGLIKNYLNPMQSFFQDSKIRATVPDNVRADGQIASLYNDLERARRGVQDLKNSGVSFPKERLYDDLTHNVDLILTAKDTKNPEEAKAVVNYIFDPSKNSKIMDFYDRDFVDQDGKPHKGRFAVYDIMTRPEIADAIHELGPESWNTYKNGVASWYARLFGGEINELNNHFKSQAIDYKLSWNSDNHKFDEDPTKIFAHKPTTAVEQNQQDWIMRTVRAVNNSLTPINYMLGKDKANPNEAVWDLMTTVMAHPNYSAMQGTVGGDLPAKVQEAITAAHKPPENPAQKAFETGKKKKPE